MESHVYAILFIPECFYCLYVQLSLELRVKYILGFIKELSDYQRYKKVQAVNFHFDLTISQKQKKFHFEVLAQRLNPALSRVVSCTKVTT